MIINAKITPSTAIFSKRAKCFEDWLKQNDNAETICIKGEYSDDDISKMSKILSDSSKDLRIDISELNNHREAKSLHLIRTYEDDIISNLNFDDYEINILEKMILNKKYSSIFEIKNHIVFDDIGLVLVHVPTNHIVEIPSDIEIIGRCAIAKNTTIENIEFPEHVHIIDDYAFAYCDNLKRVIMHNKISAIGKGCFYMCEIDELELSSALTEIPDNAFAYNNIDHIYIPSNVKRIGDEAFCCNYLSNDNIIIQGNIEEFGFNAFGMEDCND